MLALYMEMTNFSAQCFAHLRELSGPSTHISMLAGLDTTSIRCTCRSMAVRLLALGQTFRGEDNSRMEHRDYLDAFSDDQNEVIGVVVAPHSPLVMKLT
jgi:hypothetical protein